ncbi:DNA replication complex GINS protein psf2 [Protomyces lactucae-debilis]|uniref:DNA replication complex GINS protein PSF2 n=1 Tax=Protomyces lactucae-debilis TaxID=2754530 RepID=A0A1Y2FFF6_PROLT|nr:DNA replication complex GINS protein psf2 [Protomyces lactucae-debilis]ORY82663.1 DNA replication complex GINS protein psf2 [Protomyces lactucae-debilis]
MALPAHLTETFMPAEIAFMAEQQLVEIVPRQQLEQLPLIGGTVSRMRPPQRAQVPLWLALLLKRQRRATLVPPDWMASEWLQARLDEEVKTDAEGQPSGFSKLPLRWLEMSDLILDVAEDDIPESNLVKRLLRDLREARQAKARDGLEVLEDRILHLDNLGLMEVNELRPLFAKTMDMLRQLTETKAEDEPADDDLMADAGSQSDDDSD